MEFSASRLKVERADKHISELDDAVREFLETRPYGITLDKNPESGDSLLQYGWNKPVPGEQFGLIIGDAVHNLRAALDLAWVAIINKIFGSSEYAKFPICETATKLASDLSKSRDVFNACRGLYDLMVSQIKPYN